MNEMNSSFVKIFPVHEYLIMLLNICDVSFFRLMQIACQRKIEIHKKHPGKHFDSMQRVILFTTFEEVESSFKWQQNPCSGRVNIFGDKFLLFAYDCLYIVTHIVFVSVKIAQRPNRFFFFKFWHVLVQFLLHTWYMFAHLHIWERLK